MWDGSRRGIAVVLALGLYLTLRGYHSRDGDQAYRLPLLLNQQDPAAFARDPFVRASDAFRPHRGYLAILGLAGRPLGLSTGIFGLFAATFALTCLGIDRMARACWPGGGARVGIAAVLLVLAAKAGNVGTNHLFEAMLLDRLMALALGWTAFAATVADPGRGQWLGAGAIGAAAVVHPSLGLQLGMLSGAGWLAWAISGRSGITGRTAMVALALLAAALAPSVAMMAGGGSRLFEGMSAADFLRVAASIQSPQHMLPHLWRMPQWLAWACYPTLAALAVGAGSRPLLAGPRGRLIVLLMVNLAGLGLAWVAVEPLGNRFATTFQPFRMATVARGLCLVLLADRVRMLWDRGDGIGRLRAVLIVVGLGGDWSMVAATAVELAATVARRFGSRAESGITLIVLGGMAAFLSRCDTDSGHIRLLLAAGIVTAWNVARIMRMPRDLGAIGCGRFLMPATAAAWAIPLAAMLAPVVGPAKVADHFLSTWRFGEYPSDDVERLAVWCRENTPPGSRFVTPPGPKTFRLCSRREVAFNRSASPYHAAGLADWLARFQDHVGFRGSVDDFASSYLADRQALERRYQEMSAADRAALAFRQGADYVLAAAPNGPTEPGPLELVRVEGRYAVYRVRETALSRR